MYPSDFNLFYYAVFSKELQSSNFCEFSSKLAGHIVISEFNNCFIIHSKYFPVLKGVSSFPSLFFSAHQNYSQVFSVNGSIIWEGCTFKVIDSIWWRFFPNLVNSRVVLTNQKRGNILFTAFRIMIYETMWDTYCVHGNIQLPYQAYTTPFYRPLYLNFRLFSC